MQFKIPGVDVYEQKVAKVGAARLMRVALKYGRRTSPECEKAMASELQDYLGELCARGAVEYYRILAHGCGLPHWDFSLNRRTKGWQEMAMHPPLE